MAQLASTSSTRARGTMRRRVTPRGTPPRGRAPPGRTPPGARPPGRAPPGAPRLGLTRPGRTRRGLMPPGRTPRGLTGSAWSEFATGVLRPRSPSLPLDRRRRLRREVEDDPVDAGDLVHDPTRDRVEHLVRKPGPIGRHRILGGDGADHHRIRVGALVTHDADRPDRRQHREALPELTVEAGLSDLLLQDRIRFTQDLQPLGGHFADDPDRQTRPREWLPPDHSLGQAELLADAPDLVLEQQTQRLDELHAHIGRQAADVVMGLDRRGDPVLAARLDHVRVERALDEEANVAEPPRFLL